MSQSMDKSLLIIDLIAQGADSMTELSNATGFSKSTTHRLVSVLLSRGWVQKRHGRLMLGYRVLELANDLRNSLDVPELAKPFMTQATSVLNEAVHLAVLNGTKITYIEKTSGTRGLKMASAVGVSMPVHRTGLGKVLSAYMAEETGLELIAESAADLEPRWVDLYKRQLPVIRMTGAALDNEENESGIRCVAVPVWSAGGTVEHALSVSGATFNVSWERIPEVIAVLRDTSRNISTLLGGGRFADEAWALSETESAALLKAVYDDEPITEQRVAG